MKTEADKTAEAEVDNTIHVNIESNDFLSWIIIEAFALLPKEEQKQFAENALTSKSIADYDPRDLKVKILVNGHELKVDGAKLKEGFDACLDEYRNNRTDNIDHYIEEEAKRLIKEKAESIAEPIYEKMYSAEQLLRRLEEELTEAVEEACREGKVK